MATLFDIGASGIRGIAPTPVSKYVISNYLVKNDYMALQEFDALGRTIGPGNIAVSITSYDEDDTAAGFRAIGREYDVKNYTPKIETYYLKNIGTSFEIDRSISRGLPTGGNGMDMFLEQQMQQAINHTINAFAKYSLLGDSSVDAKQFDGFKKFFVKYSSQVASALDLPGGIKDEASALKLETYLHDIMSAIDNCTEILTTKKGLALLRTLNSFRYRGVDVIEINNKRYNQVLGVPVVVLPDSYFWVSDAANEIPLIFGYVDVEQGIRYVIPTDGQIIDIVKPEDGVMIKKGAIEMFACPIFPHKRVAAYGVVDISVTP